MIYVLWLLGEGCVMVSLVIMCEMLLVGMEVFEYMEVEIGWL